MKIRSIIGKLNIVLIVITTLSFFICAMYYGAFQPLQRDTLSVKSGQFNILMHLGAILQPKTFKRVFCISFVIGSASLLALMAPYVLIFLKNWRSVFAHRYVQKLYIKTEDSDFYIGNSKTKIFHNSNCSKVPKDGIRTIINSRDEAFRMGYMPCRNCKP